MNPVQCCIWSICALTQRSLLLSGLMLACVFFSVSVSASLPSDTDQVEQLRDQYLDAEKYIRSGRITRETQFEHLHNYPLYPYLKAAFLKKRLTVTDTKRVQNFLNEHDGAPFAEKLRKQWLDVLARKGLHQQVIDNFRLTNNVAQLCTYSYALMRTGRQEEGYSLISGLWLNGGSLPDSCDKPINLLKSAGRLSNDLIWSRIKLVMAKRNHRLATYLAKQLPRQDRDWLSLWKQVQRSPTLVVNKRKTLEKDVDNHVALSIVADGVQRLSRKEPLLAAKYWKEIKSHYKFEATTREDIEHQIAQSLAKVDSPLAYEALQELDINNAGSEIIAPHVFISMHNREWESALAWIDHLSAEEKNSEHWQYWRARILESLKYVDHAHDIYSKVAMNRSYYGFLAAERIGSNYEITNKPINIPEYKLIELQKTPALSRARELLQLDRVTQARIEWNYAIESMNYDELLMAAQLADKWGWQNRSIMTLAKAKYWDEIELRFPLTHREYVENKAREEGINPAWAFAVIRQESAFMQDARSPAGALGLMQLMPGTARHVARTMRIKRPGYKDLLKSDVNITLGINYLRKLQKDFSGNTVLATAAYNAGPSNVNRWLANYDVKNTDLWIELVPYAETREYLKRVLTYTIIYEQRLGLENSTMFEPSTPMGTDITAAVF